MEESSGMNNKDCIAEAERIHSERAKHGNCLEYTCFHNYKSSQLFFMSIGKDRSK